MNESKVFVKSPMALKDYYKSLRDSASLFVKEIAENCGVSERTVYNWINGEIIPDKLVREKIATIIEIPEEILFPNQPTNHNDD